MNDNDNFGRRFSENGVLPQNSSTEAPLGFSRSETNRSDTFGGTRQGESENGTRQSESENGTRQSESKSESKGGTRQNKKADITPKTQTKTLSSFVVPMLILCVAVSALSGVLSSLLTVRYLDERSANTPPVTTFSDELISVPTERPVAEVVPQPPVIGEEKTVHRQEQSDREKKAKGEIYAESVNGIVGITGKGTKKVKNFLGIEVDAPFTSTGSGFFVTEDGYIVTNYHVIANAEKITVTTYDGKAYEAKTAGFEKSNDIAVLKTEGKFTPVRSGDSSSLAVGDDIVVIGNPLGDLSYTFTNGVVSYLNRAITTDSGAVINMYQTNAAINDGNSGGPVYDMYGDVVGVASVKYTSSSVEGLGFFIPYNDIRGIISDIIEKGSFAGKPSMGISVQPVTSTMSLRYSVPVGLYVVAVGSETAAARAGIKAADVITGIDTTPITGVAELDSVLLTKRAGDTVTITLKRAGAARSVQLTLDEYKPSAPRTNHAGVFDY